MIVKIQDCRDAGYCVRRGVKPRCADLGIDFQQLVRTGIPVEDLAGIDDADVKRVVAQAEKRHNGKR